MANGNNKQASMITLRGSEAGFEAKRWQDMWWRIITDAPLLKDGSRKFLAWTEQGQQGHHVLAVKCITLGCLWRSMLVHAGAAIRGKLATNCCKRMSRCREQSEVLL
jgi:hypothetical protein